MHRLKFMNIWRIALLSLGLSLLTGLRGWAAAPGSEETPEGELTPPAALELQAVFLMEEDAAFIPVPAGPALAYGEGGPDWGPPGGGKFRERLKNRRRGGLMELLRELNLSQEQRKKIQPLFQQFRQKMAAGAKAQKDGEYDPWARMEAMKKELAVLEKQIRPMLTKEQLKKLDAAKQHRQGERHSGWGGPPPGHPPGPPPPGGPPGHPPPPGAPPPGSSGHAFMEALRTLNLSGAQKQKIHQLALQQRDEFLKQRQTMKHLSPEQRRAKMKAHMEQLRGEMAKILTPQQLKQFQAKIKALKAQWKKGKKQF